ncbi:MAG: VOC family protein [Acetobacteraceae bacterium]|nr:VOC family protein [Pseudomonadota bacterium]
MTSPPMVSRILETSLYVEDLDRSAAFYQRVFGFQVMLHDFRMVALAVPGREVLLLFRKGGSTEPSDTPYGPIPAHDSQGVQHLCFAIPADALEAWRHHLEANGVALESELTWPQATSLYFRDPDGHSLEVATPGLWANDRADWPGTPAA